MELEGCRPNITVGSTSGEEDAIIGGGIIGTLIGIGAAESAESVGEAIFCVVLGGLFGAGIPAAAIGIYKGSKLAWKFITSDK